MPQEERRETPPLPVRRPTPVFRAALHLLLVAQQLGPLLLLALYPPLPRRLGLRTLGVHLFLEVPLTSLLGLGLVNL